MRRAGLLAISLILLLCASGCGQPASATGTAAARATAPPATPTPLAPATPTADAPAPDLGALAYVRQGDLWVRQLPGGAARRLTSGGDAAMPRWSPSGAWLLYCAGDQLHVIRASGSDDRSLGACDGGAWAPHADTLVHATSGGASLVTPGVWREQALADRPALWSPDGGEFAAVREQAAADQNAAPSAASLWRMTADGKRAAPVYAPAAPSEDGIILAGWYGTHIFFWNDPLFSASLLADGVPLLSVDAAGGSPRELAPAMLAYPDFLAPAPDGQRLALVVGAGRETWAGKRIALASLAGGGLTYLTDELTAALSPAWSPDGQRIAYVAAPDRGPLEDDAATIAALGQRHIWVMRPDSSGKRQITADPAYRDERPRWSADGRRLLFARIDQRGQASLWLTDADGGMPVKVADIGPFSDDAPLPLGYYGHISWEAGFDWWRDSNAGKLSR